MEKNSSMTQDQMLKCCFFIVNNRDDTIHKILKRKRKSIKNSFRLKKGGGMVSPPKYF